MHAGRSRAARTHAGIRADRQRGGAGKLQRTWPGPREDAFDRRSAVIEADARNRLRDRHALEIANVRAVCERDASNDLRLAYRSGQAEVRVDQAGKLGVVSEYVVEDRRVQSR